MSMATEESKNSYKRSSWLPLSWGIRVTIAVTGSVVFVWLAIRQKLHFLPTFSERLGQIAPSVLERMAAVCFLIWAASLFREYAYRLERKHWTPAKWLLFVAWVLTAIPGLGDDYAKYLWPSYRPWPWIFRAEFSINFLMLVLFLSAGKSAGRDEHVKPRPEWWITAWIWLIAAAIQLVMILPVSSTVMTAVLVAPFLILILVILASATSQMRYLARSGLGLRNIAMSVRSGKSPFKDETKD